MKRWTAIVAVVAVTLLAGIALAGTGSAGDGSTFLYPPDDQEQQTVSPGEEFELDLYVSEHGDLLGNGLENFTLVAAYDASKLTATDVDAAGWFDEGNESVDILTDSDIDEQNGVVTLGQEIDPAGNGVLNTARFATITFEADESAAGERTVVGLEQSTARLAGGFELTVFAQPGQEGGQNGPEIAIESTDEEGVESTDGSADDDGAGFGISVVVIGVVTAAAIVRRQQKKETVAV